MLMHRLPFAFFVLGLAACGDYGTPQSTAPAPPAEPPAPATCNAEPVQGYVGQVASAESGAAILKASGARTLRWGPPNSAWTMDYRPDRVNVRYDDAMKIIAVSCG